MDVAYLIVGVGLVLSVGWTGWQLGRVIDIAYAIESRLERIHHVESLDKSSLPLIAEALIESNQTLKKMREDGRGLART